jgi:hypothetical protein
MVVRGRLAEKEAEARALRLAIDGGVSAIRMMLAPFAPIEELQTQQAAVQAVELAAKHAEYLGVVDEIANMKKALGMS